MWNIIFHILVMESSFFMSDFSDFFKKIRIHKYFNILDDFSKYFWRFFRIIKSFWNTIKLNDFYKIKQFGGFFKIFGEILRLQMPGNLWRRALTVFTQMNKKTQNGQKWGGSYPTRRPLEPSFMRFLTGNLWRRALTVFTQMNKKTRNGQKWGVVTLTLFNS